MSRRDIVGGAAAALVAAYAEGALAQSSGLSSREREARSKFDFLHGSWNVTHRKLKSRLTGNTDWYSFPGMLDVAPVLGGLGNFDDNWLDDPDRSYWAHSLRLYNPAADTWSIWWLDGRFPAIEAPVVGNFAGPQGRFFAEDSFEGRSIRVRTTYESLDSSNAQWTQAFSADAGATWEVNWIMDFKRRGL
jgi:hypothetical protein